jgi:branched-chain amino acid transport system substrate-binding protein
VSRKKLEKALKNWQDKLANHELELSITASQSQIFESRNRIEQCEKEIERIKNLLNSYPTEDHTYPDTLPDGDGNSKIGIYSFQEIIKQAKRVLFLSLLIVVPLALYFYITSIKTSPKPPKPQESISPSDNSLIFQKQISAGERSLSNEGSRKEAFKSAKLLGTNAILNGNNYGEALTSLNLTRNKSNSAFYKNAPETLIYINNASVGSRPAFNIAVATPISDSNNVALGILRGVALAQKKINEDGGLKDNLGNKLLLKIILVDDRNNPIDYALAKYISGNSITISNANKNVRITGLIGHQTSDLTLGLGQIYQDANIPVISPSATSEELIKKFPYVHSIAPTNNQMAIRLAQEIPNKKNVIVFYDPNEKFSGSFGVNICKKIGYGCREPQDIKEPSVTNPEVIEQRLKEKPTELVVAFNPNKTDPSILSNIIQAVANFNRGKIEKKKLFSSNAWYDELKLKAATDKSITIVRVSPWDYSKLSGNSSQDRFLKDTEETWGTDKVNWYTIMSYNATMSMATAIKKTTLSPPNTDKELAELRTRINDKISSSKLEVNGALGRIYFSKDGYVNRGNSICIMEVIPNSPKTYSPNCQSSDSISIK